MSRENKAVLKNSSRECKEINDFKMCSKHPVCGIIYKHRHVDMYRVQNIHLLPRAQESLPEVRSR